MVPNQVVKKLKNTSRKDSAEHFALAVAVTEAREAAYQRKPKAFMIKEPVVVFSSASGSAELDMPHGAWQLLSDNDSTSDSEEETTTPVCADTSQPAAVAEDPATRDTHMDPEVAHMVTCLQRLGGQYKTANEPVATSTFAECVQQSLDLQKEAEPQLPVLSDREEPSEKEEAPEAVEVAKTELDEEDPENESPNEGRGPPTLRSRGRSRKRERSRETSVSIERIRVKCRPKNWSTCTQIVHAGLDASLVRRPASNASPTDCTALGQLLQLIAHHWSELCIS